MDPLSRKSGYICFLFVCCSTATATGQDIPAGWFLSSGAYSGGLAIPDGGTLPEGVAAFGINDYRGRQYAGYDQAANYLFGMGLFRYVELSGRLAHYQSGSGRNVRDLSANLKLSLPKFFEQQPDIAVGFNDLAGGAAHFKSKYVAVSEQFGPLRLSAGVERKAGAPGRAFGGAELALWRSGASVLVERFDAMNSFGLRYASRPLPLLWNARVAVSAQRAFNANAGDGERVGKAAFGVALHIPLGGRAAVRRMDSCGNRCAGFVPNPEQSPAGTASGREPVGSLESVAAALVAAGLERVRVGRRGSELLVEYENHRFNTNEADALGVALGAGALLAPDDVSTVSAVAKKAGSRVFMASVDRAGFRRYMDGANAAMASPALAVRIHPPSLEGVSWSVPAEGPRGNSRVRVDPQLVKFVGTELGVFDYSLAANVQLFVPLWDGAELTTSYISTIAESSDVKYGFFGWAQQRSGWRSAVVSQALWLGDRVSNVTSLGKFLYDAYGVQNETTWFLPYADDQVRVQYTRLRDDVGSWKRITQAGSVSYLWHYMPLQMSVELGFNRYRGRDNGPFVQVNRWFGDVQVQLYFKKTQAEERVGFGLAFPLTPRKGMRPGWTHLEGSSNYPLRIETKLANANECNCITAGVMEEIPMVYSARMNLFNNARFGQQYFEAQLPRMRDAARLYVAGRGD